MLKIKLTTAKFSKSMCDLKIEQAGPNYFLKIKYVSSSVRVLKKVVGNEEGGLSAP